MPIRTKGACDGELSDDVKNALGGTNSGRSRRSTRTERPRQPVVWVPGARRQDPRQHRARPEEAAEPRAQPERRALLVRPGEPVLDDPIQGRVAESYTGDQAEADIDSAAKKYIDKDVYPWRKEGEQRVTLPDRAAFTSPASDRDRPAGFCYRSKVMLADVDVLVPDSADEAIAAFGDGDGVTVVAGGTIVMPELAARPAEAGEGAAARAQAGLDRSHARRRQGDDRRRDARSPTLEELRRAARDRGRGTSPTARSARRRRSAATSARPPSPDAPARRPPGAADRARRDASARPARAASGPSRSRTSSPTAPAAGSCSTSPTTRPTARPRYAAVWRPHTHHYTILAVVGGEGGTASCASPPPAPARTPCGSTSASRAAG